MDINGKVAIVTGGASGLGEATVKAYVKKGAKVAIFDMNAKRAESIIRELGDERVAFFEVNVADEESVKAGVLGVMETFGAIHICNNFAGIAHAEKTLSKRGPHALASYKKIIDINLVGTFDVSRLVAEQMAKNEPFNEDGSRGVIVNTASVAAYEGQVGQIAYSASKGGVVGMTLPMARDLAYIGVRVNSIVPGLITTPAGEGAPESLVNSLSAQVVHPKRFGRSEEIANLSVLIAENDYMNGECIRLDGGIRMMP